MELEDIVKLASTPIDKIESSNETHFMLGKTYQTWVNNYRKKMKKGVYDEKKAIVGMKHLVKDVLSITNQSLPPNDHEKLAKLFLKKIQTDIITIQKISKQKEVSETIDKQTKEINTQIEKYEEEIRQLEKKRSKIISDVFDEMKS